MGAALMVLGGLIAGGLSRSAPTIRREGPQLRGRRPVSGACRGRRHGAFTLFRTYTNSRAMARRVSQPLRNLDDSLRVFHVLTFRSCGLVMAFFSLCHGVEWQFRSWSILFGSLSFAFELAACGRFRRCCSLGSNGTTTNTTCLRRCASTRTPSSSVPLPGSSRGGRRGRSPSTLARTLSSRSHRASTSRSRRCRLPVRGSRPPPGSPRGIGRLWDPSSSARRPLPPPRWRPEPWQARSWNGRWPRN